MKNIKSFDFPQIDYSKTKMVLIETPFQLADEENVKKRLNQLFAIKLENFLQSMKKNAKKGFLLYVYGLPETIPLFHEIIKKYMEFKYWIAMKANIYNDTNLPNSHLGLLLYSIDGSIPLKTKEHRIDYTACSYCEKNISDWGGKKHLMNKKGTSISDVWKDFYPTIKTKPDPQVDDIYLNFIDVNKNVFSLNDNKLNQKALQRIKTLSECKKDEFQCINIPESLEIYEYENIFTKHTRIDSEDIEEINNRVFLGDSIALMKEWKNRYPNGVFDLIFADPPYNLDKDYKNYEDNIIENEYIQWCNEWLDLSADLLKDGGSIFILNIPKWSLEHFTNLSKKLKFQNWIVWDAMSTPKGKIMPAHYSLLHFSKNSNYKYNKLNKIEALDSCNRISCRKKRKDYSIKMEIDDIWSDIHRIKHNKYKNDHPCHLPPKLMERIILMFSNENDLVFDPFSGVGTTAMAAFNNNRYYTTIDISEEYVSLSKENIKRGSIENNYTKSKPIKKPGITKKKVELFIQELTKKEDRRITSVDYLIEKIKWHQLVDNEFEIENIKKLYNGDLKKALKASRIKMLNKKGD
jgi:site-specific DNA-methyltransferase (adenine-specific)